jgi:hypothetical protein
MRLSHSYFIRHVKNRSVILRKGPEFCIWLDFCMGMIGGGGVTTVKKEAAAVDAGSGQRLRRPFQKESGDERGRRFRTRAAAEAAVTESTANARRERTAGAGGGEGGA